MTVEAPMKQVRQQAMTVIMFVQGWELYLDLCCMVGEDRARVALGYCIDYCQRDLNAYNRCLERIAVMPTFNPDGLDGVSDLIVRLGNEFYHAVLENHLFEFGPRDLPFVFGHIGVYRLYLHSVGIS